MLASKFTVCSEKSEPGSFGDILTAVCLAGSIGLGISPIHCSALNSEQREQSRLIVYSSQKDCNNSRGFRFFLKIRLLE